MRVFGWTVALIIGAYSAYVLSLSVPDMIRYVKLSRL